MFFIFVGRVFGVWLVFFLEIASNFFLEFVAQFFEVSIVTFFHDGLYFFIVGSRNFTFYFLCDCLLFLLLNMELSSSLCERFS